MFTWKDISQKWKIYWTDICPVGFSSAHSKKVAGNYFQTLNKYPFRPGKTHVWKVARKKTENFPQKKKETFPSNFKVIFSSIHSI